MRLASLHAVEILASGGYPTIEVEAKLASGTTARASVAYGASAGSHEAVMLTDQDPTRYHGRGVLQVVDTVNAQLFQSLSEINPADQNLIDQTLIELDGTKNKHKLGGNALLATSLAIARVVAQERKLPLYRYIQETFDLPSSYRALPQPMMVVIEGGKHADNTTDIQEYCIVPNNSHASPTESIRMLLEVYHQLKSVLAKHGLSTNVGNEGAFAPNGIQDNEAPFKYMETAVEQAGYAVGADVSFAIDAAASEFFQPPYYNLQLENKKYSTQELIAYFSAWMQKYPLKTVEDLLTEDDWQGWSQLKQECDKHQVTLIGDDLTVSQVDRLQKALSQNAISGILIKLNQAGTLTETVRACQLAQQHNIMIVPSHRGGGETSDTSMVDLAVAVGATYIKVGPTRGERVVKYNRLMEIERELANSL